MGELEGKSLGERLREAGDAIAEVAEEAPDGDFDEKAVAEFEEEYGEVPELPAILHELEDVTRHLSILVDAMEPDDE